MKLQSLFNLTTRAQTVTREEQVNVINNLSDVERGDCIIIDSNNSNNNKDKNTTCKHYGAMCSPCTAPYTSDDSSNTDIHHHHHHHHNHWLLDADDRASLVDSVFSTVRSLEDYEEVQENNESELYLKSNSFQRACPERLFALTITLLLEIPVLMMVSGGGSDQLCQLIGRSRYQLLIGFLPLTSAISGNVGLQASTLTTRAISHSHVTVKDYWRWLRQEIAAALYLGGGMGTLLGTIAFVASGMDLAFGVTICVAQLLSIVTAGLTGTLAPLLFSFIFQRDSGKWGGPLETAIQDIVGSFAMVIVSYYILLFLGPGPVDAWDVCGPTPTTGA